ncbi:guanylate kinase [Catenuloplanes nepalensis]|uniref:Guanylate kinase n=1 Tax=Catenuloplanes nepalensis TaxID=587533 RepID=A0ABT9N4Y7_9ACTN|nr:kinase [Catenuloplanes nepalensis]MDP9798763.1 guanylate kinase [Catenuloplanes nepalensis]
MTRGLILYGPPASGKDTITHALAELDPTISLFRRLKAGPGRTGTYRMTTEPEISHLRAAGDVIWENSRYDAVYVIDRPGLTDALTIGTPVVHLGQLPAIDALTKATPDTHWTVTYLWCPRDVAEARIVTRATGDTTARLRAWEETEPVPEPDLFLNTAETLPADAAHAILNAMKRSSA